MPFGGSNDLLEQGLDETMSRLRGGNVDDTWWRNLLDHIGHQYVAPEFLRKAALQEWLADEEVQRDTKALARARELAAFIWASAREVPSARSMPSPLPVTPDPPGGPR